MAAGNRHLGYKEALNAIEEQSPGSKHAFYFGFLERVSPMFVPEAQAEQEQLQSCAQCGTRTQAAFPEGVTAPVQYGPRIGAMVVYLLHGHFLPEDPRGMEYLHSFFALEDQMIASGKFQHDFAFVIARRKPTRVQKVLGRTAAYAVTKTRAILRANALRS